MKTALVSENSKTNANVKVDVSTEISTTGVYCIAACAGAIGLWAVTCLFAGMATSGGPVELLSNLFKAIIG